MNPIIPQNRLIQRIRQLAEADQRINAAMMYGSFALGEADQYSDIDCMLYFQDETLTEVDPHQWVGQVQPVLIYYVNEFGNHAVVYDNFVRAEFHFEPASKITLLDAFEGRIWFPSLEDVILTDKTGDLSKHVKKLIAAKPEYGSLEDIRYLDDSFCNWMLFGCNVFARGETARAWEILNLVHNNLLRLVRISAGSTSHWINPARMLEHEISKQAYQKYQRCTSRLASDEIRDAYQTAWAWGIQLLTDLYARHHAEPPAQRTHLLSSHLHTLLNVAAPIEGPSD